MSSAAVVGKGQIFEMNGLSKVTLSVVSGFEAATTNVCAAVLGADGAVLKTRVAPAVAPIEGGHEKWVQSTHNPDEKLFAVHLNQVDDQTAHYFMFVVPNPKREPDRGKITFSLSDERGKHALATFVFDNCSRKKAHIGIGIHRAADGAWFFRPVGESSGETEFGALSSLCVAYTKEPIIVFINLVAARGLRAFDLNGKSDPYVIVKCNRQTFKTDTAKKTLAPSWNNSFRIAFWSEDDLLKKDILMEMFDWDSTSEDDFMGVCALLVSDIAKAAPGDFDAWLKLEPDARIKASKVQGEIHIIAKVLRPAPKAAAAPAATSSTSH